MEQGEAIYTNYYTGEKKIASEIEADLKAFVQTEVEAFKGQAFAYVMQRDDLFVFIPGKLLKESRSNGWEIMFTEKIPTDEQKKKRAIPKKVYKQKNKPSKAPSSASKNTGTA